MTTPTVGRVVWFYAMGHDEVTQPHAAIVAAVHNDRLINVAFFDANGVAGSATNVTLLQDDEIAAVGSEYCCWMPFQKGQAAKTEEIQRRLDLRQG